MFNITNMRPVRRGKRWKEYTFWGYNPDSSYSNHYTYTIKGEDAESAISNNISYLCKMRRINPSTIRLIQVQNHPTDPIALVHIVHMAGNWQSTEVIGINLPPDDKGVPIPIEFVSSIGNDN